MNFETQQRLSARLAFFGFTHTVQVGRHDKFAPEGDTSFPEIHCRVDLGIPRGYDGGLAARIAQLEEVAAEFGLILATGIMGDGLTFSTPANVAARWTGL